MDSCIMKFKSGSSGWDPDVCTLHSARLKKEPLRKCPSNLTHSELEDLYFKVLEANEELKIVANNQQETIKLLTTKVRRNSAFKAGRVQGSCCTNRNAVIEELNNRIQDMQLANTKLTERVRTLTLRACSAKQFLKRSSVGKSQCLQCTSALSVKNLSFGSTVPPKRSQTHLRMVSVSCQCLIKDDSKGCEENKCINDRETLKLRISELEELLSSSKTDTTIEELQSELLVSRAETARARSEAEREAGRAAERAAQREAEREAGLVAERGELRTLLIAAEGMVAELTSRLTVESRRVAELQAELRAAADARPLLAALEHRLSKEPPQPPAPAAGRARPVSSVGTQCERGPDETAGSLAKSDDSGFADPREDKKQCSLNDELLRRITELQQQVEMLSDSGLVATEVTHVHENNSLTPKEPDADRCEDSLSTQHKKMSSSTPNEKPASVQRKAHITSEKSYSKIEHSISDVVEETADEHNAQTCTEPPERPASQDSNKTYVKSSLSKSGNDDMDIKDKTEQTVELSKSSRHTFTVQREVHDRTDGDRVPRDRTVNERAIHDRTGQNRGAPECTVQDRARKNDRARDRKARDRRPARTDTTSPDNTDYDISSISDCLTDGHRHRCRELSLGEAPSSAGEVTDLSEGELPRLGRRLSKGEWNLNLNGATDTKIQAEETLKAIKDDLVLCRRLLNYTAKVDRS